MFQHRLQQVRAQVQGERAFEDVCAIARYHRVQASPGYDEAAAWLRSTLERIGAPLEIEVETVPGDGRSRYLGCVMPEGWECVRAGATLVTDTGEERLCDYAEQKLSLVLRSAPAIGRFPLVALDDGTEDWHYDGLDVRGKVVLTRGNAYRVHRLAVVERGAAGLLCDGRRLMPPVRDASTDPDALTYTSFWWSADEPRGWGFVVSPARGASLRARLARGDALQMDVLVESRRFVTTIPLVSAVLRGGTPGEILITAHLCHPQPSANDNGSGVAAAIESARALAALRRSGALSDQGRTIRFLWMPEFTGTYAWLGLDPMRAQRIVAALNLDMVGEDQGACGSTLLVEHPPHFEGSFAEELVARIRDAAQDWVTSYSGPGHYSLLRMADVPYSGGSDHAVWIDPAHRVPCPMLIQWPDRFYHSSSDTPDKTDPGSLALAARIAATYAACLATADGPTIEGLVDLAGRGARRRLLAALERPEPQAAALAELRRGASALGSVGYLLAFEPADSPAVRWLRGRIRQAWESLEAFYDANIAPSLGPGRMTGEEAMPAGRRPTRRLRAPLDLQRHLLGGWPTLDRAGREAWRRLELSIPGGSTALDVAWYACDGERRVPDIVRTVRLEGHAVTLDQIEQLFDLTARLGLSSWDGES